MAHAQKPDFFFRRNGRVHLNRPGGQQFSRLLAAEVCSSAVVMLDTPCSEVVWRVLSTHCIRQFPLHFASRASPCAITFQPDSTEGSGPFWSATLERTIGSMWIFLQKHCLFLLVLCVICSLLNRWLCVRGLRNYRAWRTRTICISHTIRMDCRLVAPKVCSADPTGPQGIRGYIYVMNTLKFNDIFNQSTNAMF